MRARLARRRIPEPWLGMVRRVPLVAFLFQAIPSRMQSKMLIPSEIRVFAGRRHGLGRLEMTVFVPKVGIAHPKIGTKASLKEKP